MDETFVAKDRHEAQASGGRVVIETSPDVLLAVLSLYPDESGTALAEGDIRAALQAARVTHGIEPEQIRAAIEQAASTHAPVERFLVARGRPRRPSRDARYDYPSLDPQIAAQADPGDPAAHLPQRFTAEHIVGVREGETVAVYHPIDEGEPGLTIRGEVLSVKPAVDQTPKPGQNLRWENKDLVSTADGRLIIDENGLRIATVLEFPGDLTVNQGDIDFIGGVLIGGNVEAGLTIRCRKDLVVKGTIVGCNVCCDGNMTVEKGIVGTENTTIEVRGNLTTRFVESANLRVWGSAAIADSFKSSTLLCGETLDMTAGTGHLVGGHASARRGIKVRTVGIPFGTKARLSVGRDMLAKERVDQIAAEVERHRNQYRCIRDLEARVGPMTKAYQKLPPRKQEEIELLLEQLPRLERRLQALEQEAEGLHQRMKPLSDVQVVVLGKACADAIVEFPFDVTRVASEVAEVAFRFNDETAKIDWVAAA